MIITKQKGRKLEALKDASQIVIIERETIHRKTTESRIVLTVEEITKLLQFATGIDPNKFSEVLNARL